MNHRTVLIASPGTKEGQFLIGMEAQRAFPGHWDAVMQITIPTAFENEDINKEPELVRSIVNEAIDEALEQWPWPWSPRYAYIDYEPDGWIYRGSISEGFNKYDGRLMSWMIDQAKMRLGDGCKIGLYGVPHIPRGREVPTEEQKLNMISSELVLNNCDYLTANYYIGNGERSSGKTQDDKDAWGEAHIDKINSSIHLLDEISRSRPIIPMLWTGWLSSPAEYFWYHFSTFEDIEHISKVCLWFNVTGSGKRLDDGTTQPSLKTMLSIERFREVERAVKDWVGCEKHVINDDGDRVKV